MKVSRSDIITDFLVDYPQDSRFIKVPAEKYIGLLGIELNRPQIAMVNAINNPKYRFVTCAVSRRVGKTYIANIIGQLVSLVPGSNVLIMSPNYSLSQISFDLQRQLIKYFDLEVRRDNAKDKIIEMENGSTIRMGSVTQVDSTVGRSYDLIIFDEAALSESMDAFNVALRPTLDKPNSKCIFVSTPRGRRNWFYELYERGFDDKFPSWVSIHATYEENPRVSAEDIEEARNSNTEAYFAQEYLADFRTYEGKIWDFNFETQVKDLSSLNFERMDRIAGLDMGSRDPTAFCAILYDPKDDLYYVVDEYYKARANTEVHAINIQKIDSKYELDFIYIDSAAAQTKMDLASIYDISTINAQKSVLDGINFVANIIENDRLFVDQGCRHVLNALEGYHWDPNPNLSREKPVHDEHSHMADALRYALYSHVTTAGSF